MSKDHVVMHMIIQSYTGEGRYAHEQTYDANDQAVMYQSR
jgi:hypothetical protein